MNTITFVIDQDKVIAFLQGKPVDFYGISNQWSDRIQFTYKVEDVEIFRDEFSCVKIKLVSHQTFSIGPK